MSSPLAERLAQNIAWLNERLDEARAKAVDIDLDGLRDIAHAMLGKATIDPVLADLSPQQIHAALKLLTIRFHLRNKAEQMHIARVNRRREQDATKDNPRSESLAEAVKTLKDEGLTQDRLLDALGALDIRPTFTAHPTESRRRSVMQKQQRIADLLAAHDDPETTPTERARARSAARQTLSLLLTTDEVRARRLEVIDEVRNGLGYLSGAVWKVVPSLYRDLADAMQSHFGERVETPIFLRYRSWIGGDRDGNPSVTAHVTRRTFEEMRAAAISRHAQALDRLHADFSVSERRVTISSELTESIERDERERPLDPQRIHHLEREPFRIKLLHMQARLGDPAYTADRFIEDLELLQRTLEHAGLEEVAQRGPLFNAIVRARTFGFHLAALDIRQHSEVHEAAVAELLRLAGVEQQYTDIDEEAKLRILRAELQSSRPLLARGVALSEGSQELLDALEAVAERHREEPAAIGSYVISMAHQVSDLLEVLILLREVGLWMIDESGAVQSRIDVAPLFETVDDLDRAADVMRHLFEDPAYAAHLRARDAFQEIMLGYSDSNKDGGYWAANWRLQVAQDGLAQTCADAGVAFRFFHGRGGTVARGGGRAHRAILSSPTASRNGRIRFTEQGEVISFRYAMPPIAHRHLEQITGAMLLATARTDQQGESIEQMKGAMESLAQRSRSAYRELIDSPAFWPWFIDSSPVLHIGELPIASRPVSRSSGQIEFANLRAIPWVFAWTQMRYNAPGWFGVGAAMEKVVMNDERALGRCQSAYASGGFFRAFIDNAQQEMARARLDVARWYAAAGPNPDPNAAGAGIHDRLAKEFERTERAILTITAQDHILDNNPVIQQSIHERNPDTDVINALQVELLRRWREADDSPDPDATRASLRPLILLSVNALAAAMQSTG